MARLAGGGVNCLQKIGKVSAVESTGFRNRVEVADRATNAMHPEPDEDWDHLAVGGHEFIHDGIGGSDHVDPSRVDAYLDPRSATGLMGRSDREDRASKGIRLI